MNPEEKKAHERKVFLDALRAARSRGGEARRNADRLCGSFIPREGENERPDMVIRPFSTGKGGRSRIVGVEHFSVDHYSEGKTRKGDEGRIVSRAETFDSEGRKLIASRRGRENDLLSSEELGKFGKLLADNWSMRVDASPTSLMQAYRYSWRSKHKEKVNEYRNNLSALAATGESIELAFLIEAHSDFSDYYLNVGGSQRKIARGELPLFPEIRALLKEVAKCADWIILAHYPACSEELTEAFAISCKRFNVSASRQGLLLCNHGGLDTIHSVSPSEAEATYRANSDDSVTFMLDTSRTVPSESDVLRDSFGSAADLYNATSRGEMYAATMPVQMLFCTVEPEFRRYGHLNGSVSASDARFVLSQMKPGEHIRRSELFAHKWGIGGNDEQD